MWEEVDLKDMETLDTPLFLVHDDGTESDISYLNDDEIKVFLDTGSRLCRERV